MARMRAPERRRQLLEVAATLFAERGYRGTTTADLAAAAGVSEPIIYRHFESKLALFVTLLDEVGEVVIESWRDRLAAVEDPDERLTVLLDSNPATHPRGRAVYRLIFHAMTEQHDEPEIATAIRSHFRRLHAFVKSQVAGLQKTGNVRRDETPDTLAWLLVDAAVGLGMVTPLGIRGRNVANTTAGIQKLLSELLTR